MKLTTIKTCCVCGFTNAASRGKFIDVDEKQGLCTHERCAQRVMYEQNLRHAERLIAEYRASQRTRRRRARRAS
jgi:hypothetical protein